MRKFIPFLFLIAACSDGGTARTSSPDSVAADAGSGRKSTQPAPPPPPSQPPQDVSIRTVVNVANVQRNDTIASPFTVKGSAHGSWYFEAQFLLRLVDSNGRQLAIIPAKAQGDWMRDTLVPFSGQLKWKAYSGPAELVFQADNPSGDPKNHKEWRMPVVVK